MNYGANSNQNGYYKGINYMDYYEALGKKLCTVMQIAYFLFLFKHLFALKTSHSSILLFFSYFF